MLQLFHGEPNGFSLMPLVTLHEKGRDFDSHYVDPLRFAEPAGVQLNLEAEENLELEGPLLVHDGGMISDSFFMIEYLDAVFPDPPLTPRTLRGDWQVQVWGRFLGERAAPAVATLGVHKFLAPALRRPGAQPSSEALDRMRHLERRRAWIAAVQDDYSEETLAESRRKAGLLVERVERTLGRGDLWLVANSYGLADIAAFALAMSLPKLIPEGCNERVAPATCNWMERMRARPAVQRALAASPTGQPDEAFVPGPDHATWG